MDHILTYHCEINGDKISIPLKTAMWHWTSINLPDNKKMHCSLNNDLTGAELLDLENNQITSNTIIFVGYAYFIILKDQMVYHIVESDYNEIMVNEDICTFFKANPPSSIEDFYNTIMPLLV